jgi:ribose transport system permease protein
MLLIIIVACTAFPVFGTLNNIKSILLNASVDAIIASGMMILLISGVFDLSVGSMIAFSGGIAGTLMYFHDMNTLPVILITLSVGIMVGSFTGFVVAYIGVNPMIATLAMMTVLRGGAMLFCGTGLFGFPDSFVGIAGISMLGFRAPIWYMLIIGLILTFLVYKSSFFRRYYYIGGNEKAAQLSGINVKKMRLFSYILTAFLASLGGIIMTSRMASATSTVGMQQEMKAISACILGGASMTGGQGSIPGAILGAIFLGLVQNLLIIGRVPVYWQNIVTGAVLLIAILIDVVTVNRARKMLLASSINEADE